MIDIAHIDLNLLVVFHEMYRLRNVSQVAKRLGLSQPTVSNALSRLRKTCGDELFVRTGQGMQPTPYGQRVSEPIAHALSSVTQALNQEDHFNPATSKRNFVIAMTDVGEIHFMPALVDLCRRTAPYIGIGSVRASAVDWQQGMETGQIDLAIGAFANVPESLYHRKLFSQGYVTMFRRGHRFGKGSVDLKTFLSATHLLVTSRDSPYDQINARLEKAGVASTVSFQVPHFTAVPYIISTTDMVVTVPKKLAEQTVMPFALDFIEPPFRLPMLNTNILWHRRYNQDKGNQWLRGLIAERFKE
ncbi:LysR family transcriptional regulator [Noviherbaspirillum sp. Root189]|uniref:LysR family transcriptional regulator n=1 Tax=Noviherbaspirillum sp. Root189 TaxID=1736487 RepID=UPI00070DFD1C|nr:LysR family transcriptional regulator [Noviherbaspirillum sp. Root189]KRB88926.1 LysR family transcriptional regulator [Noviherbaspirillum sp. Root189]